MMQNMNIWISAPPPNYRLSAAPDLYDPFNGGKLTKIANMIYLTTLKFTGLKFSIVKLLSLISPTIQVISSALG